VVDVGVTSPPKTVTLTNAGPTAVHFANGYPSVSQPYRLAGTTCAATMPAGSSCTLSITLRPTAVGATSPTSQVLVRFAGYAELLSVDLSGSGGATPPADCSVTANAPGSVSPGAPVALTAVCNAGTRPFTFNWSTGQTGPQILIAPTTSRIYTVDISNAAGTTTASVEVSVVEPPAAANYQGLWWNAPAGSEPGWGITLAHQGDIIFAIWFTYDSGGQPWWLAVTAELVSPNVYSGNLFTTTGPPFDAAPFEPAMVTETTVGSATFTFADNDHATFDYTVDIGAPAKSAIAQTKTITRQEFGVLPTCVWGAQPELTLATNYEDIWWRSPAGSESGWGIYLTHQGDQIFATWFTYDAGGKPLWFIVDATKIGPNTYAGPVSTVNGPPFNSVPFNPETVVETIIGTATLAFADGNNASFAYTVNGTSQIKPITRQVFAPPGTACQ
jgi:hypothetical protein